MNDFFKSLAVKARNHEDGAAAVSKTKDGMDVLMGARSDLTGGKTQTGKRPPTAMPATHFALANGAPGTKLANQDTKMPDQQTISQAIADEKARFRFDTPLEPANNRDPELLAKSGLSGPSKSPDKAVADLPAGRSDNKAAPKTMSEFLKELGADIDRR
jgi:hypothetical protein